MPCFYPLQGWRSSTAGPTGKHAIVFQLSKGFSDQPVTLPCGKCLGCRLDRSRAWAVRCYCESKMHQSNEYITLTYNKEHLPKGETLVKRDFQNFMKRLRKKHGKNIKYFQCGEYGPKLGRPHYHACLFNVEFTDKKLWKIENGNRLYTSQQLSDLWSLKGSSFGFSSLGSVTFQSAAYVARYILNKKTGEIAKDHYKGKTPEYITMSLGGKNAQGGIGASWLLKYYKDVYPDDFVVIDNRKHKPPRYFDQLYEKIDPEGMREIRLKRVTTNIKNKPHQTSSRLRSREKIQEAKANRLPRNLKE